MLPLLAAATPADAWTCYGSKPGHPTPAERAAFVQEVSVLARAAEKKHGVPAAALAAMAIVESSYGYTRLALEAHNLFAWRAGPSETRTFTPVCERNRPKARRYVAFASRADAFDRVAEKLASLDGYREYTGRYRDARKRGQAGDAAVDAWVAGIAKRYSRSPQTFAGKVMRVMKNPEALRRTAARGPTLYELSKAGGDTKP
jgi:uncharacterized FlgJ-related protein